MKKLFAGAKEVQVYKGVPVGVFNDKKQSLKHTFDMALGDAGIPMACCEAPADSLSIRSPWKLAVSLGDMEGVFGKNNRILPDAKIDEKKRILTQCGRQFRYEIFPPSDKRGNKAHLVLCLNDSELARKMGYDGSNAKVVSSLIAAGGMCIKERCCKCEYPGKTDGMTGRDVLNQLKIKIPKQEKTEGDDGDEGESSALSGIFHQEAKIAIDDMRDIATGSYVVYVPEYKSDGAESNFKIPLCVGEKVMESLREFWKFYGRDVRVIKRKNEEAVNYPGGYEDAVNRLMKQKAGEAAEKQEEPKKQKEEKEEKKRKKSSQDGSKKEQSEDMPLFGG